MNKNKQQKLEKQKEYQMYKGFMKKQRNHKLCHKRYSAYQSVVTKKKSTVVTVYFMNIKLLKNMTI